MTTLPERLQDVIVEFRRIAKDHEIRADRPHQDDATRQWHMGTSEAYDDAADRLEAALEWARPMEEAPRSSRPDWFDQARAALRSKQPTASEGDKYLDQLCHVVHALTGDEGEDDPLTVLERYAANGATLTYPDDANTSKQAAGEAVATVCLRGDTYAHGLFTELQVQHKEGVTFPIGTKFYLAPRHPADDGRDADSYYAEKAREQQDMIVLDKYADIARALGFPCDTWFGDPLASHEAIVSHATKLAALAGREAGEAASA